MKLTQTTGMSIEITGSSTDVRIRIIRDGDVDGAIRLDRTEALAASIAIKEEAPKK